MTRALVGALAAAALLAAPSAAKLPVNTALHPALTAVFSQTSYSPSAIATLRVTSPVRNLDVQILRAGAERAWSSVGKPWGPEQHIKFRRAGVNLVRVRLGAWTSGLYFARLTTTTGKTAVYAPFVLRPDEAKIVVHHPSFFAQ